MRVATVHELAGRYGLRLPAALTNEWPPTFDAGDERGWFRFQRLYDAARACVRSEADLRQVAREAALDDFAEGSRWLELQVDPTSYAPFVGGITPALEIILDEARQVSAEPNAAPVALVVAAIVILHPREARPWEGWTCSVRGDTDVSWTAAWRQTVGGGPAYQSCGVSVRRRATV